MVLNSMQHIIWARCPKLLLYASLVIGFWCRAGGWITSLDYFLWHANCSDPRRSASSPPGVAWTIRIPSVTLEWSCSSFMHSINTKPLARISSASMTSAFLYSNEVTPHRYRSLSSSKYGFDWLIAVFTLTDVWLLRWSYSYIGQNTSIINTTNCMKILCNSIPLNICISDWTWKIHCFSDCRIHHV